MKQILFLLAVSLFVFNCSKDDGDENTEFQKCWKIIDSVTQDPISGADVEVFYEHHICYACPYTKELTSDSGGKACQHFKNGSTFVGIRVNKSGYNEYYKYVLGGGIPNTIRLVPRTN